MRVRIITLNVWNTEGDGRRHKIINQELRRLKPDFLALQEFIQTPQANTLDTMIEGLGLHVTHQQDIQFVAPPYADRYGGTAIATRWPHQMVEVLDPRTPQASDVPWATLGQPWISEMRAALFSSAPPPPGARLPKQRASVMP